MKQQNQTKYIPPLVLDYVELETESPILTGSGVDPFQNGTVMTNGQYYEELNFGDDQQYNQTWEQGL